MTDQQITNETKVNQNKLIVDLNNLIYQSNKVNNIKFL